MIAKNSKTNSRLTSGRKQTSGLQKDRHLNDLRPGFSIPPVWISPRGMTLIEILIALTMTMIVLFAMAQAFQYASAEIAKGRSVLEMSSRLRNVDQLLRTDLAGVTVSVQPHLETYPEGYFEIVDPEVYDKISIIDPRAMGKEGYYGDVDDILAFTSRRLDGSFQGRYQLNGQSATLRSSFAEILWYPEVLDVNNDGNLDLDVNSYVDFNETIALYRRVLLIRPDLNKIVVNGLSALATTGPEDTNAIVQFFRLNDISARWIDSDDDGQRDLIVANTLNDLAKRENRFVRDSRPQFFPHTLLRSDLRNVNMGIDANRPSGEDILITDMLSFDVQVYSPDAVVNHVDLDGNNTPDMLLNNSDVGFNPGTAIATGGFVDLGKPPVNPLGFLAADDLAFSLDKPMFQTLPAVPFGANALALWPSTTYCTWSPHYEADGYSQFGSVADRGTNGIDDDGQNGIDDYGEYETIPPYPYPVRGIKVSFRIVEKGSRQVRQTSVIHRFPPQ
jgi:hypothetical protein